MNLVLLVAYGVFLIWNVGRSQIVRQQELLFCLLIITFYVAFVILAKIFLDPGIGFNNRMFIPLFPFILLVIVLGVRNLFNENWGWRKRLATLPFIYLILVSIIGSWASLPHSYNEGLGWNRRVVVTSKAMQELRELSASSKNMLFNNDIFGMYFFTGQVGEKLAQFPPEDAHEKVYLVIFKVHLERQHPLLSKYADELIPIVEDEILSIHLFESKENHQ